MNNNSIHKPFSYKDAFDIFNAKYTEGMSGVSDKILQRGKHKLKHSAQVLMYAKKIIKLAENTENYETITRIYVKIKISALLHDLGRFYQHNKIEIKTNTEFDHAEKSYEIVKEFFPEDISLAIKLHDKKNILGVFETHYYSSLSEDEQKELIILINIVRDADKIANLIYNSNNPERKITNGSEVKEGGISKEIIEAFKKKETVLRKNVKTKLDMKLYQLAWIFDLNFKESFKILSENDFFEKVKKNILDTGDIDEVAKGKVNSLFKQINDYISKR